MLLLLAYALSADLKIRFENYLYSSPITSVKLQVYIWKLLIVKNFGFKQTKTRGLA